MIKRRTLGVVAATALLGGLGAYGASAAFASSSDTTPSPAPSSTSSPNTRGDDSKDTDAMIRHCTEHLPADQRDKAEKQMREMMSDHDDMSEHSMMGDSSGESMGGMMGGSSADAMSGMMGGTGDGS
ncbi:hypothetical protein [Streptomyces werraensis]|uniref:hypothetical protein n=1 Tax=Streptomyces werraensis TaxID=68284 RepID=UPI0033AF2D13